MSVRVAAALALAVWTAGPAASAGPGQGAPAPLGLGISGTHFTLNGAPRFLLGVSLFDGLGTTAPEDRDFDTLAAWGISLVRVWAHWSDPIYDRDGALTEFGRARLIHLVTRLDARGMVLELVLLRPGQLAGQAVPVFESPDSRVRAVEALTRLLRPYRLVLFDLYNEHDHEAGPISHAEGRRLREAVKAIDPDRIVTMSSGEAHILTQGGELDEDGRRNLAAEVSRETGGSAVDLLAPHLPRTGDWAATTGARLRALRRELDRLGRTVPIYLNEEHRARPGQPPIPASAYLEAAQQAKEAGAAGWVFHTSAGFDLGKSRFLDTLNPEERQALERLGAALGTRR